jgi:hypothetical protein
MRLREAISVADVVGESLDGPSASLEIYSNLRREIWRVGDVSFQIDGKQFRGSKLIDVVTAGARAAIDRLQVLQGVTVEELRHSDAGRKAVLPLIQGQYHFRNLGSDSDFGYGSIDGSNVPDRFIDVFDVPDGKHEVVFTSDGYPEFGSDLDETVQMLRGLLAKDMLMIGSHMSTKGVMIGADSFDDRAYIRFVI